MKILLIDDDPVLHENLAVFFQDKGYPSVQASTGAAALNIARQHPIGIIISSQEMQDMDGIELCRNIREGKKDNYIYYIQLTRKNEKEKRLAGYHQGVDAYLTNPPDLEELEAKVSVGMRMAGFNPLKPANNPAQHPPPLPEPNGEEHNGKKEVSQKKIPGQIKREDICNYDILFARLALEQQFITKELLARAFSFQKKEKISGNIISIDEIFLGKKMIAPNKIKEIRRAAKWQMGRKFANIVLKKEFATQKQVRKALKEQTAEFKASQQYKRTGDILVANQAITKEQCDLIRCEMARKKTSFAPMKSPHQTNGQQGNEALITLMVSHNKLEARIELNADVPGKITPDDILDFLNQKNIVYGVAGIEQITEFLNIESNEPKIFLAAKGHPAVLGYDASIDYHFETDHLKAGTINEDGTMDYRERGESPRVQRKDLLATKIAMESGKPGIDVHNTPIPVPDTNDAHLKCGQGTLVSENGLEVYATIDGQPNLTVAGELSVFAELIIDGDVDFNTGNIDFDGNVVVKGAINDGFTIKCGNLTAQEIFGAKIFAIGDVTISGGIIKSDIKAEGDVNAKFITNSNIKSFGSVVVHKEVIDSKIRSSGNFITAQGKIISSFISAKMGFESAQVGSDASKPCRIHVGMDENIKKRIQELNHTINDKKLVLETLQKNYETASKQQDSIHFNDPKILDENVAEDLENIKRIIKEIESISDEKQALLNWSKEEKGIPVIQVKGSIFQGTKIFGIYASIIPEETIRNIFIKEIKTPNADSWEMVISDPK